MRERPPGRPEPRPGVEPTGFERPRPTRDPRVRALYEKYELGVEPSLAKIEPVAMGLLSNLGTLEDGATLVLGRALSREDEGDRKLMTGLLFTQGPAGKGPDSVVSQRFGILLMELAIEERAAQEAAKRAGGK